MGLNFDTLRPRQEILADYEHILESIYDPVAYAGRLAASCHHARQFRAQAAARARAIRGAGSAAPEMCIGS